LFGVLGANAQSAVPALIEIAKLAANALKKIDPEAAARAGAK
jgi:hypothetical protein